MDAFNKESQESESNNNTLLAFDQHLILKLVLEHVGRADVADLKKCRLVSHSWNKAAVEVLEQQHDCAIELDSKKMIKYKSLLWNTKLRQLNSIELKDPLASLRLSIILQPLNHSEDLSEAAKWIQLLLVHPHLRIAFIKCSYDNDEDEAHDPRDLPPLAIGNLELELFNLLKLASPNLTSFTICDNILCAMSNYDKFETGSYGTMEFAKLASIRCQIYANQESGIEIDLHIASIIRRAPNLIKLVLGIWDVNYERHSKTLTKIVQSCADHIEKLEIIKLNSPCYYSLAEGQVTIVTKVLGETKFQKLNTLKMNWINCSFSEFTQILSQCPALGDIDIQRFSAISAEEAASDEDLTLIQCPSLANIRHLGLYNPCPYRHASPEDLEQIRWNFATKLTKFPFLDSMSIDLEVLFKLGAHLKNSGHLIPPPEQYPELPNVSSLDVHILFFPSPTFDLKEMAAQIYRRTFPNLRKLVIKPHSAGCLLKGNSQTIICQAIEFLSCHPGLEILEIHDYAHDWLGQIPKANIILQGMKSLKLVPPRKPIASLLDHYSGPPHLNISDFLTRFPSLEHFQFGKKCLYKTEILAIRCGMSLMNRFE